MPNSTTLAPPPAVPRPSGNGESALQPIIERYECGPVRFSGDANASYERHLVFDHVVAPKAADVRQQFEAVARSLRDLLAQRWLKTQQTYDRANPKRVYYLSMEFLIGRSLTNNITNLLVEPLVRDAVEREGLDPLQLAEQEPDAGLGNGGLGRLAACFIDSLATHADPGHRLRPALRVRHLPPGDRERLPGRAARQLAAPARPVGGRPAGRDVSRPGSTLRAEVAERRPAARRQPADDPARHPLRPARRRLRRPDDQHAAALGRGRARTSSTSASSATATSSAPSTTRSCAETLTRVLYPDDSTAAGRALRFVQEYFLVACSLADIVRRFRRQQRRLARPARQGRHPAQRHAPVAGRRRADAHPARRGASSAGTRPGT